jgi:hypothetical protein
MIGMEQELAGVQEHVSVRAGGVKDLGTWLLKFEKWSAIARQYAFQSIVFAVDSLMGGYTLYSPEPNRIITLGVFCTFSLLYLMQRRKD